MGSIPIARSAAAWPLGASCRSEGELPLPLVACMESIRRRATLLHSRWALGKCFPVRDSAKTIAHPTSTRSDQRERPTPPRAAARTKRPRRLGEDLVDDFAVDVGESAVDAVVAEGETLVVDA